MFVVGEVEGYVYEWVVIDVVVGGVEVEVVVVVVYDSVMCGDVGGF